MTCREYYAPKISDLIKSNSDKSVKEIRKILYKANPGQYGHMKKIWSDESLKQLGLKRRKHYTKEYINNPNQSELFS